MRTRPDLGGVSIDFDYLAFQLDTQGSHELTAFAKENGDWLAQTLDRPIWDVLDDLLAGIGDRVAEAEARFL